MYNNFIDIIRARKRRDLTSNEKLVLIMVISHRNPDTGKCFPAQSTLAAECGLAKRTLRVILKNLETQHQAIARLMTGKGRKLTHYSIPWSHQTEAKNNLISLEKHRNPGNR